MLFIALKLTLGVLIGLAKQRSFMDCLWEFYLYYYYAIHICVPNS